MHQIACAIGPQTEAEVDRYVSLAASPNRRSDHGRVLFRTRTLLFLVDCEKSCLGAAVQQRGVDAEIRQTKHDRRLCAHTTDAASSGSFLRRTRQTLNASKSVRNWTPNRGEVDRYVSLAGSPSRRSDHGRVLFSARTVLFLVDPEKSCLGGMLPQGGIDAEMRRTDHNRRQYTHATDADSSGSFLRRTRQTLNASKSG